MFLDRWGATDEEVARPMVGDQLVDPAPMNATRSITIGAPPSTVFPWLRQIGFRRAGWYSYDWVDNLGRTSARSILPEFQSLESGDSVPGGGIDFTAFVVRPPIGKAPGAFVLDYRNRAIEFSLAFDVRPGIRPGTTRLVSRARAWIGSPLGPVLIKLLELGDGIMVRRQLVNLRKRIEAAPVLPDQPSPG